MYIIHNQASEMTVEPAVGVGKNIFPYTNSWFYNQLTPKKMSTWVLIFNFSSLCYFRHKNTKIVLCQKWHENNVQPWFIKITLTAKSAIYYKVS